MTLPVRLRRYDELSEQQKETRFHNYHFANLKAADLRPLIKEKFRPLLKASGFSRASDSLSIRVVGPHYIHCLRLDFSSVCPGRFFVRAGIALDLLPQSDPSASLPKRINVDTDCLFTKDVTLPNGNPEFDNGTNLTEANETIRYLVSVFKDFDRDYFSQFSRFPAPLDGLGVDFVQTMSALIKNNSESEFGKCGATIERFTLRLAVVHNFLGNTRVSKQLVEYGLANFKLFALKSKYEQLLGETRNGPPS